MQEAAKDLVNVEEDAIGGDPGGERGEEGGLGEEGPGPLDQAEECGAEEGGGALSEQLLPDDGGAEKHARRVLDGVSGETKPSSAKAAGGDRGVTRKGEGHAVTLTGKEDGVGFGEVGEALTVEAEMCRKTAGGDLKFVSSSLVTVRGLDVST